MLQVACHVLDLGEQFCVAGGRAEELDRGLGRKALRRIREALEDARLGNVDLPRKAAASVRLVEPERARGPLDHAGGRRVRVLEGHVSSPQKTVSPSSSRLAIVRRWISEVPSGMRIVRAKRKPSSRRSSLVSPMPPCTCMQRSITRHSISVDEALTI